MIKQKIRALLVVPLTCVAFSSFADDGMITIGEVVDITIDNSSMIVMQKLMADQAKGMAQIASGMFDVNTQVDIGTGRSYQTTIAPHSLNPADRDAYFPGMGKMKSETGSKNVSFSVTKPFRTGVSATLSASANQYAPRGESGFQGVAQNTSNISFNVNVPLLKRAGREASAADETAAKYDYEAALADAQHAISSALLQSISAFWKYAAAQWYLGEVGHSRDRVQSWIDKAGRTDKALQSYLEDKKGKLIDAKQSLDSAKVALANAMGITADKIDSLGNPQIDFVMDWEETLKKFDIFALKNVWLQEAARNRLDLKSMDAYQKSAKAYLDQSRKNILPSLDLNLNAGYTGLSYYDGVSDLVRSYHDNLAGMDYSVGLSFNYSIGNNLAKGMLTQSQGYYQLTVVNKNEKLRSINLEVHNDIINVQGRMQKAVQVKKTAESYTDTLVKMMQDESVAEDLNRLFAVMELEDKHLEAEKDSADTLSDLASAIAQARFTTGTLIVAEDETGKVNLENLKSLPGLEH